MLKRPWQTVLSERPVHHFPGSPMSWLLLVVPFSSALSLNCLSEQFQANRSAVMAKVQGLFVGHRKFAVDRDWLRQQEEQRYRDRQRQFDEWSSKWVTVTRLKETRLWTDGAIKRWLGEPQQQGKYKVFPVEAVLAAEKLNEFQLWLKPRLEKKRALHHHFLIPFL